MLNFLLIATGAISQICAALPSTWQLPTAATPAPPVLWKFKTGQSIENAVAVGNGIVYAGSDDDSVYALNATTGEKIWQDDEYSTTSQSMMTPTVADGIVYFSVTGTLYAADSMNGTVLWKYRVNQVWHNQTINDYSSTTSPAIKDNIVYVGSGSYLSALHAKTGELKWIIHGGWSVYDGTIDTTPKVAEGIVYFGSNDPCNATGPRPDPDPMKPIPGCIWAAEAESGSVLWKYPTHGMVKSDPAVANGIMYIGSNDGSLYALDAKTGSLQWQHTTSDFITTGPTVGDGIVYFGSWDGNFYAADAKSGAIRWTFACLKGGDTGGAFIDNGIVYVGSSDNHLYALNAKNGALQWSYSAEGECEHPPDCWIISTPSVVDGILYVGSDTYYMYAFKLSGLGVEAFYT